MIKVSFSDPGLHPKTRDVGTFADAVALVKRTTVYTEAFVSQDGQALAFANREVGTPEWKITLTRHGRAQTEETRA